MDLGQTIQQSLGPDAILYNSILALSSPSATMFHGGKISDGVNCSKNPHSRRFSFRFLLLLYHGLLLPAARTDALDLSAKHCLKHPYYARKQSLLKFRLTAFATSVPPVPYPPNPITDGAQSPYLPSPALGLPTTNRCRTQCGRHCSTSMILPSSFNVQFCSTGTRHPQLATIEGNEEGLFPLDTCKFISGSITLIHVLLRALTQHNQILA